MCPPGLVFIIWLENHSEVTVNKSLVSQWMTTNITSADPHMRLHDALRLMNHSQIRSLPILENGHLIGIVTKRDLLRADTSSVLRNWWDQYRLTGNLPLEKVMTTEAITLRGDNPAAMAARILMENKITTLPVVDEETHVIGMVTSSDMFRLVLDEIPSLQETILVRDYMTRDVQTIDFSTTLLEAQRLMAVKRIRSLPVMQGKLLVGIVTRTDILSATPSSVAPAPEQDEALEGEDNPEAVRLPKRADVNLRVLNTPIRFIMTSAPITISEGLPSPRLRR
jgi:CBS domain-containing protein